MSAPHQPVPAFAVACFGIFTFSLMDALMKQLSIESGAYSAVLWRSLAGVVMVGAVYLARGHRWPTGAALRLHLARGLAAGLSVLLFFWGLARVPMAQAVALTFLAPLLAQFMAAIFLGEKVGRGAIGGSLLAAAGVALIGWGQARGGGSGELLMGSAAVILASFLYAGSLILLRQQAQLASPLEVTLFSSIVIGGAMLPAAPWLADWPAPAQLPWIALAALIGSASGFALAWAYRRAEAQLLSMVEYTAFIWAALLGYVVFSEAVAPATIGGALLIIAGCLVAVRGAVAPAPQTEAAA